MNRWSPSPTTAARAVHSHRTPSPPREREPPASSRSTGPAPATSLNDALLVLSQGIDAAVKQRQNAKSALDEAARMAESLIKQT